MPRSLGRRQECCAAPCAALLGDIRCAVIVPQRSLRGLPRSAQKNCLGRRRLWAGLRGKGPAARGRGPKARVLREAAGGGVRGTKRALGAGSSTGSCGHRPAD